MFTFRGLILIATLTASTISMAMAQITTGPPGTASAGPFTCSANVANPMAARSLSYAEALGDIVITCTGGTNRPLGSPVPTANITVALNNTLVTSRVFSNGLSEALLVIDEAGATGANGATGPGPDLPQTLCAGGALGAGPGGCETYADLSPGISRASTCIALSGGTCTSFGPTPTVFQGAVSGNQVVFNGVPILAPVTSGLARIFRILNVRVNATTFGTGHFQGEVALLASISISSGVTLQNPVQTTAFLFDGMQSTAVRNATNTAVGTSINLLQCATSGLQSGAVLRFNEGFANAWKTRISSTASLSGAGTPLGSTVTATNFSQNVPGAIYNGSESNFVFPVSGGTAGLVDFGTRLKATFSNVPSGVAIYVSTTNINPLGNTGVNPTSGSDFTYLDAAVRSGNLTTTSSMKLLAGLVTSETATAAPGSTLPLLAGTNTAGNVRVFGPLPVDANGTATAVWEFLLATPTAFESAEFAVFYAQTAAPPLSPAGAVALGMAPTFGSVTDSTLLPRWTQPTTSTNLINVTACPTITVGVSSAVNPSTYGQATTFTATVTGASGTVTFKDGATTLGTATIAGGQAVFTTDSLTTGTHSITATVNSDPPVTSSVLTHVVNKSATSTTVTTGGSANASQPVTFTATVTGVSGVPSGMVTFRDGGAPIGTASLDAGGTARLLGVALPIGSHSITAIYSGDANFSSSTSAAQGFVVNSLSTSVSTPVLRSGTPAVGVSLTFAATVSGDGPAITGMLTFQDGGRTLGSAAIDASGTAAVTASLGAGTHAITASYGGDVLRSGSTSAALVLTIKASASVTLTSSANPAESAAAITLTAAVAGATGQPTPTGGVTFREGTAVFGSGTLDGTGKATLTLAEGLATGDHSLTAVYGGDSNYDPATSPALVQQVAKTKTGTTLTQGVGSAGLYLTALVGSALSDVPVGSVEFQDVTSATSLGTASLANGRATLTLTNTSAIGHTVRAVYNGNERFAGSASPGQTLMGATNGFSLGTVFVPDSLASLFGTGLAGDTASAPGMPLPTTLAGTRVWIVDSAAQTHPAELYYVSPGQINFVVPADTPLGPALIRATIPGGALSIEVTIVRAAPALASANGSGSGPAAAQVIRMHRDGSQEQPVAASAGTIPWGADGDRLFLVLYGTGLRHAQGPVSCTLNGAPVTTLYMGAHGVYPGLDQVNVEVTSGLTGTIAVRCSADGQTSNTVTVNVQ